MLALDQIAGSGRTPTKRRLLARAPGCRLELGFWYGASATRPMLGIRARRVPDPDLVEEAVRSAAALGIQTLYTEAVPEATAAPFLAAGFGVADELILMARPLGLFEPLPRPGPPSAPVSIVSSGLDKLEEISALDARAFPDFWSLAPQGLIEAARATKSSHVLVARLGAVASPGTDTPPNEIADGAGEADGGPTAVAYVMVGIHRRTAYLQRLAVDPAFARRGIGSALCSAALRRARRSLASVIWVNTPIHNTAAISLYQSLGFERTRSLLLVLAKDLAASPSPRHAG